MREKDEELLAKEQARHMMLAPLRGQQLKNYVSGIRNHLNAERTAEKKALYNEAVTKYVTVFISVFPCFCFLVCCSRCGLYVRTAFATIQTATE